jgi:UDP-2-acetamido-2,6-beta-L-arabino-hexul-4-ose reductase
MLRIGITGETGFIGKNFSQAIGHYPDLFCLVKFDRSYFKDFKLLSQFVSSCDVIVHLAALSRHPNLGVVFENNISLTKQLIGAMTAQNVKPYLIFTSSTQDKNDTEYGNSKREEYILFNNWAKKNNTNFSCIVLNNIFGPHCKPNYASFVATFCYKLVRNEVPCVEVDNVIRLTYIDNLINYIIEKIINTSAIDSIVNEYVTIPWDVEVKVSEVLLMLNKFKNEYLNFKAQQIFSNEFEKNLFITFKSYYEST